MAVADTPNGLDVAEVTRLLRARGCHRIFVEGGGVTVSMFLEANLLDRLQVAIAPLIIGNGRPAIRLPPRATLSDCRRPPTASSAWAATCSLTVSSRAEATPPESRTSRSSHGSSKDVRI